MKLPFCTRQGWTNSATTLQWLLQPRTCALNESAATKAGVRNRLGTYPPAVVPGFAEIKADFIIDNNGQLALLPQVIELIKEVQN